jgi:hypothetical protein
VKIPSRHTAEATRMPEDISRQPLIIFDRKVAPKLGQQGIAEERKKFLSMYSPNVRKGLVS